MLATYDRVGALKGSSPGRGGGGRNSRRLGGVPAVAASKCRTADPSERQRSRGTVRNVGETLPEDPAEGRTPHRRVSMLAPELVNAKGSKVNRGRE